MNNSMKIVMLATMLLSFGNIKAQKVKNQSEIIKANFKTGEYKVIASLSPTVHMGKVMNFEKIIPDKSKPEDNLQVIVQLYPESRSNYEKEKRTKFFADKEIFPVSYISTNYEGNRKLQEQNGYVVRRSGGEDRFVFVKNYVFYLEEWKSKDDYYLRTILSYDGKEEGTVTKKKKKKKKKSFGGFFKALKTGIKTGSSGGGGSKAKIEKLKKEVLQPYLDAATAIQTKMQSSPEALKAKRKAASINKKMNKAIDNYNNVVYVNKTGRTIYIYRGSSTKGAMYGNGVKVKFPCTSGLNYDFTGKKWYYPNKAILLNRAGTTKKCGKTIEIK